MSSRRHLERTVKPRRNGYKHLPIIAVGKDIILTERGEAFHRSELPKLVTAEPSSLMVGVHFGRILQSLNDEFRLHPRWQFRVNPIQRQMWSANRQKVIGVTHQTV